MIMLFGNYEEVLNDETERVTIGELVAWVAPTIDVDLWAAEGAEAASCVLRANDWLRISHEQLLTRVYLQKARKLNVPSLQIIGEESGILGFDLDSQSGAAATIGGLRCQTTGFGLGLAGVYKTNPMKADRSGFSIEVLAAEMPKWATQQAKIISTMKLSDEEKARIAFRIIEVGGSSLPLEVATIITQNGVSRADEITLHRLFDQYSSALFTTSKFNADNMHLRPDINYIISPDYFHTFIFITMDGVINQIYETSAGRILAKAWGYSKAELQVSAEIQHFTLGGDEVLVRIERRL